MSSLLFLGLLAFDSGFATFMGCILLISLILGVIRLFFYIIYQIIRLIWKSLPPSFFDAVLNNVKEREAKVARGETCIPPFVSYQKLFLTFIMVIIFGGAGLIFSLLIVFWLTPLGLPDPILKGIWILNATVLSVFFSIRSVHYAWPEYESWVKKKYFSKKQKERRGEDTDTEEKKNVQNHLMALVGEPRVCKNENAFSSSPIRARRKFYFSIAEMIVRFGVACVFAVVGGVGAILGSCIFAILGTPNDSLIFITRFLLCLLPTCLFFLSFKYT